VLRIFLVRHGQTPWTAEGRYQGATDIPLDGRGIRQAKAVARVLRSESPDRIYTSTLKRARETARWIARAAKLRPIADHRLNEIHFGEWEGMSFKQMAKTQDPVFRKWREGKLRRAPGGESISSLARRVGQFFKAITKCDTNETLVVVSHSGPTKMILLKALKAERSSIWSFRIEPASLSLIEGNNLIFQVVGTNWTHHLKNA